MFSNVVDPGKQLRQLESRQQALRSLGVASVEPVLGEKIQYSRRVRHLKTNKT